MSTCITGKLNKAANQFQAGDSVGFSVRLGVKFYNRSTKAEEYTNYEAAVFAKAPAQVQFYQQALVEGAIIEVSGDKQRIKQFQGNNGLSLSIEILDARLGAVFAPQQGAAPSNQQQAPKAQAQAQQGYNAPRQAQNNPVQQPSYDFEDDINF